MTDRELMQMSLDSIVYYAGGEDNLYGEDKDLLKALRERLARPEQEPVAWISKDRSEVSIMVSEYMMAQGFEPLYTAPPEREWVELTDEEIVELSKSHGTGIINDGHFARAIEARLREKNK